MLFFLKNPEICLPSIPDFWVLKVLACFVFFFSLHLLQFAKKFYIAQWFRDTTSEAEKAIKSQNEIDEDLKSRHYFKSDSTADIMQRAETRKKFLRKAMRASARSHSQG